MASVVARSPDMSRRRQRRRLGPSGFEAPGLLAAGVVADRAGGREATELLWARGQRDACWEAREVALSLWRRVLGWCGGDLVATHGDMCRSGRRLPRLDRNRDRASHGAHNPFLLRFPSRPDLDSLELFFLNRSGKKYYCI